MTALPGFATRQELVELYARLSGRDVSGLPYYVAFAYFKVGVILQQPESRGSVTVRIADATAAPHIDPGYLTAPNDLARLVAGVRQCQALFATSALREHVSAPMEPGPDETDLEEFVRAQAETLYHPVGTCRMGGDEESVVDPELRVRGVDGLRVVDASVIPTIIRGHTHAPTVMIAEKGADLIRKLA